MHELDVLIQPDAIAGAGGEEVGRDPDFALHVGRAERLAAPLGELELGERRADRR